MNLDPHHPIAWGWSTPVFRQAQGFDPVFNARLRDIAIDAEKKASPSGSFYDRTSYYNLFAIDDPVIRQFEERISRKFREYLHRGIGDAKAYEWEVSVRAFANVYTYGQRVRPHYHESCDFVSIYYVDLGDGSQPEFRTKEQGRLVFIDPRGAVQHPVHSKCVRFEPEVGSLVIHPAYLWHESETFFSGGTRVMVACELTILHDHRQAFSRLPAVENPNPPPNRAQNDPGAAIYSFYS